MERENKLCLWSCKSLVLLWNSAMELEFMELKFRNNSKLIFSVQTMILDFKRPISTPSVQWLFSAFLLFAVMVLIEPLVHHFCTFSSFY